MKVLLVFLVVGGLSFGFRPVDKHTACERDSDCFLKRASCDDWEGLNALGMKEEHFSWRKCSAKPDPTWIVKCENGGCVPRCPKGQACRQGTRSYHFPKGTKFIDGPGPDFTPIPRY
jgi:hypothetical protein